MVLAPSSPRDAHRKFLNSYYRATRHVYDLTRKFYLFGRDQTIENLLSHPWQSLIEVGPGTGRNLKKLHQARPSAEYGGIDACDSMIAHASRRLPWARFRHGFAEDADFALFSRPAERILFSYCLSMVQSPRASLEHALRELATGGRLIVVDFADFADAPPKLKRVFHQRWLQPFHVKPLEESLFSGLSAHVSYGAYRYFLIAEIEKPHGNSAESRAT